MKKDDMELIRGSGNVFADFGHPNAAAEQVKALLAARIIKVLDEQKLSIRKAEELTGFSASDFSRVRGVKLDRFTIDRLISMLTKLDNDLEVGLTVTKHRHKRTAHRAELRP